MSAIKRWLTDLVLLPDTEIQQWFPVRCTHAEQRLVASELVDALAAAGPVSGWLQTNNRVNWLEHEVVVLDRGEMPLAAEFFNADNSWQLHAMPRGRWQLDHHTTSPDTDKPTHLAREIRHLAIRPNQYMLYWQLWQPGTDESPECQTAVLRSIEESRT